MKSLFYILGKDNNPIPCEAKDCGEMWRMVDNRIKRTSGFFYIVSTVFLGIDHNFTENQDSPILFETAIMNGTKISVLERHATYQEAVSYHDQICDEIFVFRRLKKLLKRIL
jgi:hypothetical protein